MSNDIAYPPIREFTESEFATIGKVVLMWGHHEQSVGTIVAVRHKVSSESSAALIHSLGYSRKVDLACAALRENPLLADLATELDFVRRVFRPERDTIAHGAFGTWKDDAWVRALSKRRFVSFDDLSLVHERANYARVIANEAAFRIQNYNPDTPRPARPPVPVSDAPAGYLD